MLSRKDESGERTSQNALSYTLGLLLFSTIPYFLKMTGPSYLIGSLLLGGLFLASAIKFSRNLTVASARRLFYYSILYLPLLLGLMVIDRA